MKACKWCTATEEEKAFLWAYKDVCDSCARMRFRDKCDRCDGPRFKKGCVRCDPPPKGKVAVIVIDPGDNERLVYRHIQARTSKGPKFSFHGHLIIKEEPVVIAVSRKEFIKILC